jgi:predicted nucleic acid-binding Zn ribbon protein
MDNKEKTHFCQYQAKGCQKIATHQHLIKLGTVTIDKRWVCSNCKEIIQKQRNHEQ